VNLATFVKSSPNQVSCELQGEEVILNLQSGVYYGLDSVGAVIWKLIEEPRTVASIRDAMLEKFEVDAERCEKDLFVLLSRLSEEGLIEITDGAE
jgi:Coenzyme PQQ synthesis protein D (PqqD)